MSKYTVETYYTCTFKIVHNLDELNEKKLSELENRKDGKVEIIDVKLNNRKTKTAKDNDNGLNKPKDKNSELDVHNISTVINEKIISSDSLQVSSDLNKNSSKAAELSNEASGRKLIISTNQPGIQFYSGNHLSGKFVKNQGLCLETQHFPDSPNNDNFPTTKLIANEEYYSETIYFFDVI